jgi:tRNA threonylcarbamoyladenosine biosynthesis protein TsaE
VKIKAEIEVSDEQQLSYAAKQLIAFAGEETVFAFFGEMGAGKTTFIRHICEELNVSDTVSSPTFSIINQYESPSGPVYHFDFYRIDKEEEAFNIGCVEYFKSGAICLIEWPEKILNLLPEPRINVILTVTANGRLISFEYD